MCNRIDIEQWIEEDENELIDRNNIDSDDESEDQVEVNYKNTDTENNDNENESESNSEDFGPILQNKYFFGKDSTRWMKEEPTRAHRTRAHNVIVHLPGPKSTAKNMKTHLEYFFLFLDKVVIDIIVKSTNIKIASVRNKYKRARDARETDDVN